MDSIEVVCGRTLASVGSGTPTTINISPATFARALAVADVFQFYRFTSIRFVWPPAVQASTSTADVVIAGFAPGAVFDTLPTTTVQIAELPKVAIMGRNCTHDVTMTLGRKDLLSHAQLPWFKTILGTEDTQFEIQGNIYLLTPVSTIYYIEWCVEFQSPNLAANSPMIKIPYPLFQKYSNLLKDTEDADVKIDEHGSMINNLATVGNSPNVQSTSCVINFDGNLYKRIA